MCQDPSHLFVDMIIYIARVLKKQSALRPTVDSPTSIGEDSSHGILLCDKGECSKAQVCHSKMPHVWGDTGCWDAKTEAFKDQDTPWNHGIEEVTISGVIFMGQM